MVLHLPNPPHFRQAPVQSIIDELLGKDVCLSTGNAARRTSCAMNEILHAYYGGRHDEFWAHPEK